MFVRIRPEPKLTEDERKNYGNNLEYAAHFNNPGEVICAPGPSILGGLDPTDRDEFCKRHPESTDCPSPASENAENNDGASKLEKFDRLFFNRASTLEEYEFHDVFGPKHDNEHVFKEINPNDRITDSVFSGVNETMFGYGQTSSGKTHTVLGSDDVLMDSSNGSSTERSEYEKSKAKAGLGLIHFFVASLFNKRQREVEKRKTKFAPTVEVRCFEIFGDVMTDLIDDECLERARVSAEESNLNFSVKSDIIMLKTKKFKKRAVLVEDPYHCLDLLDDAVRNRKVGKSGLNQRSSRSHCVVQIEVTNAVEKTESSKVTRGTLTLVDLAGSEREDENPNANERTTTRVLNTSLSSLARLLRQLQKGSLNEADKRQSVLNKALFDYVQPTCGIFLIFCVNPLAYSVQHTASTLQMATDSKSIRHRRKTTFLKTSSRSNPQEMKLFALDYDSKGSKISNASSASSSAFPSV